MGQPQSDTAPADGRLLRKRIALVLVACSLLLSVVLARGCIDRYHDAFGMYHDDAVYMVTAQALSRGDGYRIMSLPGQPMETKYPIGFPFLLSIVWKIIPDFPAVVLPVECLELAAAIGFALTACAYLTWSRKITPLMAAVIFAASVLNFHYLDFAPMVMSDLPCALFSVIALWAAESLSRRAATASGGMALGLLLAFTALLRMLGILPLISVVLFLSLKKNWKLLALCGATAASVLIPYWIWQSVQQSASDPFLSYYTNYVGHALSSLPREIFMGGLSDFQWLVHLQTETAFPLLSQIPYASLSPLCFFLVYRIGFALLIIPAVAGNLMLMRKGSLAAIYGSLLCWSLLFWPAKIEWRHIVVCLPFFYYFLFYGWRWLGRAMKKSLNRAAFKTIMQAAFLAASIYLVAGSAVEALQRAGKYGDMIAAHAPLLAAGAQHAEYLEACDWIRGHTRSSDVFVCNNDPLLYLYTGRQAISPSRYEITRFISGNLVEPASMSSAIKFAAANYVMVEPSYRAMGLIWAQSGKSLMELLATHPGCLSPVYRSSHGLVYIFAVDRSKL